jgi:hypothetical protein
VICLSSLDILVFTCSSALDERRFWIGLDYGAGLWDLVMHSIGIRANYDWAWIRVSS